MILQFFKGPKGKELLNEYVSYALLDGSKPSLELLKFLINKFNLDLTALKFGSFTPIQLMGKYHAIEGIKFLLDNKVPCDQIDEYHNTILHYLDFNACSALLLEKPELSTLLNKPNIFGKLPDEISIDMQQSIIIHQFYRYLFQQGRIILQNYSPDGMCNGLSFLFELYASKGNLHSFTAILAEISSWDGRLKDSAGTDRKPTNPLLRYNAETNTGFKTLEELFEHFYNDISIFLHIEETEKAIMMREDNSIGLTHQLDRNGQLAVVTENTRVHPIFFENNAACTRDKLIALLQFIKTLPNTVQIDLNTPSHLCGLTKTREGNFLLYNPFIPDLASSISNPELLADFILQTDYIKRNKINEDKTFNLRLYAHYFNHNEALFLQETKEYTKTPEFSLQEPLTQLRYCIVTKQNDIAKELLENNPSLLNQEDEFGKRPFDYALYSLNDEIAQLLLLKLVDLNKGESLDLLLHSIDYEHNDNIFNMLSLSQLTMLNQQLSTKPYSPIENRIQDRIKELSTPKTAKASDAGFFAPKQATQKTHEGSPVEKEMNKIAPIAGGMSDDQ